MKLNFDGETPFAACREAETWCGAHGLSIGSMERNAPRGLLFGEYDISKWGGLNSAERGQLHGTMEGDMRHGPITITIKPEHEHRLSVANKEATP